MNGITNELNEKNSENITNEKKWTRNCPRCNKQLFYSRKTRLTFYEKNNKLCGSCSRTKYNFTQPYIRICSICQRSIIYKSKNGYIRAIENNSLCNSCKQKGEKNFNFKLYGKNNKKWKGYEDLTGRYWSVVRKGAKTRNFQFDITIKDAWNQFIKQNKKCALSGIDLKLESKRNDGNASLDRIDSKKGYTKDNIQWIDKKINGMKSNMNEKEFINWCKLISNHTS